MSQILDITDRARASLDRMMVQGLRHGIVHVSHHHRAALQ